MSGLSVIGNLKKLASHEPICDGFHAGVVGDNLAVELEYGEYLRKLVIDNKRSTIVEVGTGRGYSTSWLLLGLEKNGFGCLFTIDNQRRDSYLWDDVGIRSERLFLLIGELKDKLSSLPKRIDFAFLDSDHQIDRIVEDIELLDKKFTKDVIVCVHDVNYCREMGNLLNDYFCGVSSSGLLNCGVKQARKDEWDYKEITNSCGLGIARRKGKRHEN